ncbi:hypothetical protein SCUCBS95973_009456 [Sporothrix curviconia]|uniref:STAS domain-containing protein n=1 Tax=Sporothrix curviconia TaxID=1260050 RepID=A0ABP0CXJ6_9PEZI
MPRWATRFSQKAASLVGIGLQQPSWASDGFDEPTVGGYLRQHRPTRAGTARYVASLFPCASWVGNYNVQWLIGDVVAGVTVGAVVVPQSLAYARLATLDVQFGLYSSFMGHLLYWIFGTSKDISIGPIAVMSVMTGKVIEDLHLSFPDVPPHVIASGLGVVAGVFLVLLGLVRCGWLVDLIPLVSLSSFVTGSAITIGSGQLASLLGVHGVKTSDPPAYVIISTLRRLATAHGPDTAVGLSSLVLLYLVRFASGRLAARYPSRSRAIFFVATLRTVVVILLCTLVSWLVNKDTRRSRQPPHFAILLTVPAGFRDVGVPSLTAGLVQKLAGHLPAATVVLLLEHMAIAKSFGRTSHYTVNATQEMVAIGAGNVFGACLGGYPATGSFSRTAIQAKAGARTPACGVVTALVVLLAVYVLPPVFYYIPSATLAAVILHAVGDLLTPPATLYRLWRVSPLEVPIFFVGVGVALVSTIDMGIYATVGLSLALLLVRSLHAQGDFLGSSKVSVVEGRHVENIGSSEKSEKIEKSDKREGREKFEASSTVHSLSSASTASELQITFSGSQVLNAARDAVLPLGDGVASNTSSPNSPDNPSSPRPGIFVYRFREGFNFASAAHTLAHLTAHITAHARPGAELHRLHCHPGDRPWSSPLVVSLLPEDDSRPPLQAVILDLSSVYHVDGTSVQQLADARQQLDRFAAPAVVEWHLASVRSPWTRRALAAAGFGCPAERAERAGEDDVDVDPAGTFGVADNEHGRSLFHVDVTSALQSTVMMV